MLGGGGRRLRHRARTAEPARVPRARAARHAVRAPALRTKAQRSALMARRGAAALVAAALFTIAGNAGAYCRAKACDTFNAYDDVWQSEPDPPCQRDPVDCLLEGQPLHWPATCISFDVQKDGSADDGIDV